MKELGCTWNSTHQSHASIVYHGSVFNRFRPCPFQPFCCQESAGTTMSLFLVNLLILGLRSTNIGAGGHQHHLGDVDIE
jgi:hypothetical protein